MTLKALLVYHCSHVPEGEIGVPMIDPLAAFFWLDHQAAEQAEQASQLAVNLPPTPDAMTCVDRHSPAADG